MKAKNILSLLLFAALCCPNFACSDGGSNSVIDGGGTEQTAASVTGTVKCDGKGVKGVVVSDGVEVTQTDADGKYSLNSKKKYGYVFMSVPSGYEAPLADNQPQFFKRVTKGAASVNETADFTLNKVDNSKHAILAMADFHLAKRTNDLEQFKTVAADINATAKQLKADGYKVYGISLGDESWDGFWYSNSFGLAETFTELQQIELPFFHCMGNHDNDPYCPDDWNAEQTWIDVCGPVYYSLNIGDVHYIVIDDIQYLNTGGAQGTVGKRDYNDVVISEEMAWLRKDLAKLTDKNKPVVVAMHAPMYATPTLSGQNQVDANNVTNTADVEALFSGFANVTILSGHTHVNYNVSRKQNITEHNTAAICATWWWTGKLSGNSVCTDGTPGGYGVYKWNGTDAQWHYKTSGQPDTYQFRAYDLNTVYINPAVYAPKYQDDMREAAHGYDVQKTDNEVLLNVWNYDPQWKVEVLEDGKQLDVQRVYGYDPLHIISYDAKRIQSGGKAKCSFPSTATAHLFKAKASSATSTLLIRVTDRFGRVYTEQMERPKAFSVNIK